MTEAERAARQRDMDNLVPGIDPSEYGKMPSSYHSSSQRVKPATVETDVIEEISTPEVNSIEPKSKERSIRPPILPRDKYDGVDSDDETDEEGDVDSEDEEDQPQVVGDVEIDMEEEEEEFLEFARQALGLTDDQWKDIVQDRKDRGAFVPSSVGAQNKNASNKQSETPSEHIPGSSQKLRDPVPGPRPYANPNLDSFEAVMQAMDAELARSKAERHASTPKSADKGKGKAKETGPLEEDDIEIAMDAELKAALEGDDEENDDEEFDEKLDYNLIKNFLESFKSQGGLSGPVGNLVGRLQPDWKLPRDSS
ncbi:hypothetical protein QCA50_001539 [Cerrena zonata]|uniref:Uncharacterized protein n=1 Tax=Cerrena zonata TaxID=2478898 RepID=A0AAW0GV53_9APHY